MADRTMILHYADGSSREMNLPKDPGYIQAVIAYRKFHFPVGTRVELAALAQNPGGYDDRPHLPPGSTGVVTGEPDGGGSLPIIWDHGSKLQATSDDVLLVVWRPDTTEEVKGSERNP